MRKLLVFLSMLGIVQCSCPSGFELVREGPCRGYIAPMALDWPTAQNTAITKCREIQGLPIIIHDDEQQSYWSERADTFSGTTYTITGIICNTTSKSWEWADGSSLDYKPATYSTDLDKGCQAGCTWDIHHTGAWGYTCANGTDTFQIFCTTQLHPPILSADGCDGFEDDGDDGVCYQVGATANNWQDAQMNCKKLGANLASVHNPQENSFIRRLAVSKGAVNGVFLGATLSGKGNEFGWVDGSAWDYENFHPDFPMAGLGDCLAMDTSTTAGLWLNEDCSAKLPVACVRDQKPVVQPACTSGPWQEQTIITSPGFPFSASTFCDFFLTVDPGKRVQVEILFLEANSCCDFLVIYEGSLGGSLIANLTGEISTATTFTTNTSNIVRVNWQPNGVVNVRGMAMTFRGVE